MADALAQKVSDATAGAQELAGKVADQAREYGGQAEEAVKNFKPYVEKSLRSSPWQRWLLPRPSAWCWAPSGRGEGGRSP